MAPNQVPTASAARTATRLPLEIVGPADVSRLLRELGDLDDYLHQASLRQGGTASAQLPRTSRLLEEFVESNKLNLLKPEDRIVATEFIKNVSLTAPAIHISFASEPSAIFITKLVSWLRTHVHPYVLLHIGLQPNLAAGCVVRTNNKYFDFSLRKRFDEQRRLLFERLGSVHE